MLRPVVNLFSEVVRVIRGRVVIPDASNDAYTARSAANQSTSGEPRGRPSVPKACTPAFLRTHAGSHKENQG